MTVGKIGSRRVVTICLLMSAIAPLALSSETPAQTVTGNPYAAYYGGETFERDGEQVRALRIPVYITMRSWVDRPMGLRLRLAVTAAATDLFDLLEQELTEVSVLSFVPGVEFVIRVGDGHLLRPFLDAGIGTNDATDDRSFLGAIGLRTELVFPRGEYVFGLEPGVQLNINTGGAAKEDTRLNPFITLSTRRVLGFRIAEYLPDIEAYFDWGYNFQTLEFASVSSTGDKVEINLEAGIGFGFTHGRPRVLGMLPVPRFRMGYRFGDVEGFRIRLGGDWLLDVPEPKGWSR